MIHTARSTGKFIKLVRWMRKAVPTCPIDYETVAIGILERLWHFTMTSHKRGDVGASENEVIAEAIGWLGDADEIVEALTECKWLVAHPDHRLVVNDWHEHAPRHIKQNAHHWGGLIVIDEIQTRENPHPVDTNREPHAVSDDQPRETGRLALTPNLTKPNVTKPSSNASNAFDGFEEFWKVVHRKVAKDAARKAFDKAVKRVAKKNNAPPQKVAERIIEKMKLFAASKQARHEVKGNLHPATWLNEGRYEDDVSVWNGGGVPKQQQNAENGFLPRRALSESA